MAESKDLQLPWVLVRSFTPTLQVPFSLIPERLPLSR